MLLSAPSLAMVAVPCRCPEQYDIDIDGNPAVVTPAIDVWAWACCMIHMATGMVPWPKLNTQQLMMQVMLRSRHFFLHFL
jgi:hypothetical protein